MTRAQFATIVRRKTRTSSTTYPDAELLLDANIYRDEIAGMIQQWRSDYWNVPVLDDLIANQREYAQPDDVLNRLISLELKFTSSGDFVVATPIRRLHYPDALQESLIVSTYSNTKPFFFVRRGAFYILSGTISSVTDGFRLVYDAFPTTMSDLTDSSTDMSVDPSTTTRGFPREFHEILARRCSIAYKNRNQKKLDQDELSYDKDLQTLLSNFSIAVADESLVGKLPDGSTRGDNGYDY